MFLWALEKSEFSKGYCSASSARRRFVWCRGRGVRFRIAPAHNGGRPFEGGFKETLNPEPGQTNQCGHGGGRSASLLGEQSR